MGSSKHQFAIAMASAILLLGTAIVSAVTKSSEEIRQENNEKYCNGAYANKITTADELKIVLDRHQAWLHSYDTEEKRISDAGHNDPRRANLCGADLSKAELRDANLSGAILSGANLSSAILYSANFSGAYLFNTNMSGADLKHADLSGAWLVDANLSGAELLSAKLSGAILVNANMSGASLNDTDMSGVYLSYANMSGAKFELKDLPLIDFIAEAVNLDQMVYLRSPQALIKLRKAFREAGYTEQERAITSAIKHSEQWRGETVWDKVESVFKYVFFDLPTQWGMYPGRALRVLVILMGVFALPYIFALRYPNSGRIYRKWGTNNTPTVATSTTSSKRRKSAALPEGPDVLQYRWMHAILTGLQFSLLSAFHIGFREFNVGNWISRLQARDYILYATGWVRSVAGTQALISVYLLAMWALTYFGRPFE